MTKPAKPIGPFDDQKLLELTEPIAISVHKIMNGRPCPITLPVKPGEDIPGRGWTQDEVKQLDQVLVDVISGGGEYHNSATGDNGVQMKWRAYFPVDRYPEKGVIASQPAPPPSNGHVQLGAAPVAPMQVVAPTPSYMPPPGWMHAAAASMPQSLPPQQQSPPSQWMQQAPQQIWPGGYYPSSTFDSPRRDGTADREVQKEREARLALEAKIERERLENTYTTQLAALAQEMRTLKETKPQGESPELISVRAELADLKKAREDDRLAQMIREVQAQTQAQIAALTQMMQQSQAAMTAALAAKPAGPDPMIMMLVESSKQQSAAQLEIARLQADATKETARLQAEAQKEAARTALGPRELIDIMSRANSGHEQISNAYTRLMETTQRSFENMMQMQGPQTHPTIEMVQQGMQGIAGIAERYIAAKESATANQAQAAVMVAQAQAQTQVAQAQLAHAPATAAPAPTAPEEGGDDEEDDEQENVGAMERELFGPALPAVQRLRKGIALGQGDPKAACDAVLQGIEYFQKKGEPIPAFALWQQNELQQLVKVLVPEALLSFQQQMIGHLFEARKLAFKG